ncbi:hypothetical protein LIA77_01172 [Sarocladium implicatum]|jgi:hypothetical protein|nr:hypothetical protein LIA77_01172 [Sarocladium implicatum]
MSKLLCLPKDTGSPMSHYRKTHLARHLVDLASLHSHKKDMLSGTSLGMCQFGMRADCEHSKFPRQKTRVPVTCDYPAMADRHDQTMMLVSASTTKASKDLPYWTILVNNNKRWPRAWGMHYSVQC